MWTRRCRTSPPRASSTPSGAICSELFDRGRRWADLWLRDHFDSIGRASTFDVEELFEGPADARPAELPPALRERGRRDRAAYQSAMRSPPTNWALLSVYSKSSIRTPFGSVIQAW